VTALLLAALIATAILLGCLILAVGITATIAVVAQLHERRGGPDFRQRHRRRFDDADR
jgi:hypothetical protein